MAPRRTLLYLAGWGRSGSTLLTNLLGQAPGHFAAGELIYFFRRGVLEDRHCGCGDRFSACPHWTAVARRAWGEAAADLRPLAERMLELEAGSARTRHLRRLVRPDGAAWAESAAPGYLAELENLYGALFDHTGAAVVVDASKHPAYGFIASRMAGLETRFVHLVRDPRAVAFSWRRRRHDPDRNAPFARAPIWKSAAVWRLWNRAIEDLARSHSIPRLEVRYEDFVADPRQVLGDIIAFGSEPLDATRLPVSADRRATITPGHLIAGNPVRFQHGEVTIRPDDEWSTAMPVAQRALVNLLTAAPRRRYGYSG